MLAGILLFVAGFVLGAGLTLTVRRWLHVAAGEKTTPQVWRVIAVPILNGGVPRAALTVAARLSLATHGEVVVLTVVQIPRAVGIDAGSPPGLEAALARLETAEGIVRGLGAQVRGEIVRVREVGDLVGRACTESGAQAVVIEPNSASRATAELVHTLLEGKAGRSFDLVMARADTGVCVK